MVQNSNYKSKSREVSLPPCPMPKKTNGIGFFCILPDLCLKKLIYTWLRVEPPSPPTPAAHIHTLFSELISSH